MTAQQILSQIKGYLTKYKVRTFEFVDYANVDLSKLEILCAMIIKERLRIEWQGPVIFNPKMDFPQIKNMKEAGCKKLTFDLISGSGPFLKKIGAAFSTDDASRILRACRRAGIATAINLVLGHPAQRPGDLENTIGFLTENLGVIDEIENVTYCLSNYFYSNFISLPFCRHWERCLELGKEDIRFIEDFLNSIARISSLGRPVVNIRPGASALEYLKQLDSLMVRNNNLVFRFDQGKGRLYWRGAELTSGFGLYTSIFASSFWQDSEQADWQVEKLSETRMILKGRLRLLPIVQRIQIEMEGECALNIDIEMEVLERMEIGGEQQTNVMLRKEYGRWSDSSGLSGSFPDAFNEDWVTLREENSKRINTLRAEAFSEGLPSVSLNCRIAEDNYRLCALNTSSYFGARKLKGYRLDKREYLPGKYNYFKGEIKINE